MAKYLEEVMDLPMSVNELTSIPHILKGLNINASEVSYDACDAQHLMHCYQLALDFGVPTAQRALALYQSESSESSTISKS